MKKNNYTILPSCFQSISKEVRSFYLAVFVATPISWLLASLLALKMQLEGATDISIFLVLLIVILLSGSLTIFVPILAIKRFGRLMVSLDIEGVHPRIKLYNGKILFVTTQANEKAVLQFMIGKKKYAAISVVDNNGKIIFYYIPELFNTQIELKNFLGDDEILY